MNRRQVLVTVGLTVLLIATVAISLATGPSALSPQKAMRILMSRVPGLSSLAPQATATEQSIVLDIRLPRLILALLVGAALAVAGAVMQSFFQNPMAAPSILGVSAGATLGATAAIMLGLNIGIWSFSPVPVSAFIGALAVSAAVYLLSRRGGRTPVTLLLLTGIALGSLASAISSFILIRGQRGDLDLVIIWMMGSLANRGWPEVQMILPYVIGASVVVYFYARELNVLLMGDEQAYYLGVPVERVKLILLTLASLLAAAAVAVTGAIGFIGLIVPHLIRLLVGPQHRILLPLCFLGGGVILGLADIVANMAGEIPIGIVTSLIGAPFFLYLLHRAREYEF